MDILVSMNKSLALDIPMRRPRGYPEVREAIVRTRWHIEANFMTARDKVTNCHAFQRLNKREQHRVIEALFDSFLPKRSRS